MPGVCVGEEGVGAEIAVWDGKLSVSSIFDCYDLDVPEPAIVVLHLEGNTLKKAMVMYVIMWYDNSERQATYLCIDLNL